MMNKQEMLSIMSEQVSEEILRERGRFQDQCNTGARMLVERAKKAGLELQLQEGFWMGASQEGVEHNWCIDPDNGSIYDPTAEQFVGGVNGLQVNGDNYMIVTREDYDRYKAASYLVAGGGIEGMSSIYLGYLYIKATEETRDRFKKVYPDMKVVVRATKPSEVKVAKNSSTYAIIRHRSIEWDLNHTRFETWKNGLIVSGSKTRSWVVFENKDKNSFSIYPIEQRVFLSKTGKTGLLTKRGDKIVVKLKTRNTPMASCEAHKSNHWPELPEHEECSCSKMVMMTRSYGQFATVHVDHVIEGIMEDFFKLTKEVK